MSPGDIVENDTFQVPTDDDKYDYSIPDSIDRDTHYLKIREIQSEKIILKNLLINLLISKIIFLFTM